MSIVTWEFESPPLHIQEDDMNGSQIRKYLVNRSLFLSIRYDEKDLIAKIKSPHRLPTSWQGGERGI